MSSISGYRPSITINDPLAQKHAIVTWLTTVRFTGDGHYIRRVRQLKRLHTAQRNALCEQIRIRALLFIKLLIRSLAIRMAAPNPHATIVKSVRALSVQFTKRAKTLVS